MIMLSSAAVLLAARLALAQNETAPSTNSTAAETIVEGEITIHVVTVGLVPYQFQPDSVTANPGDKVMFQFYPGNHSVIQSQYGWPCIPKGAVTGQNGTASPPQPVQDDAHPLTWNLTITHTEEFFYYCGAPGSCVNYAMLGVINPARSTNLTAQKAIALEARYVLYPGDTLPAAASASVSAIAATVFDQSGSENNPKHDHGGLSGGAIAGIVVGGVAALAIIGALVFHFGRSKGQLKALQDMVSRTQAPTTHVPPEMTVDGVTYVPAIDPRAGHQSGLPPYQHHSPDLRPKSPATVSSHGNTAYVAPTYIPYSPDMGAQNRFSEQTRSDSHSPALRHELHAQPAVLERRT